MATCSGKRRGSKCVHVEEKCDNPKCGNKGCRDKDCTSYAFTIAGRCAKCNGLKISKTK